LTRVITPQIAPRTNEQAVRNKETEKILEQKKDINIASGKDGDAIRTVRRCEYEFQVFYKIYRLLEQLPVM